MSEVGQDSSMEDILASIKRVIAEDVKPPRSSRPRPDVDTQPEDDVLELDASLIQQPEPVPAEPTLVSPGAIEATRNSLAALTALRIAAPVNANGEGPLEAVVRDMLRPMLKDWLDQRLPEIVQEIVAKEVARITGRS